MGPSHPASAPFAIAPGAEMQAKRNGSSGQLDQSLGAFSQPLAGTGNSTVQAHPISQEVSDPNLPSLPQADLRPATYWHAAPGLAGAIPQIMEHCIEEKGGLTWCTPTYSAACRWLSSVQQCINHPSDLQCCSTTLSGEGSSTGHVHCHTVDMRHVRLERDSVCRMTEQ